MCFRQQLVAYDKCRATGTRPKIFLDSGNAAILDKELQDNFGTDLNRIKEQMRDKEIVTVRILKTELPN